MSDRDERNPLTRWLEGVRSGSVPGVRYDTSQLGRGHTWPLAAGLWLEK